MIFQELAAAPEADVAENVSLGRGRPARLRPLARAASRPPADARSSSASTSIRTGASIAADRRAAGRRDRARALSEARCLILDEPTAALSRGGRAPVHLRPAACASVASRSSTSRTGSTRCSVADRVRSCATASRCSRAGRRLRPPRARRGDGRAHARRRQRPAPRRGSSARRRAALRGAAASAGVRGCRPRRLPGRGRRALRQDRLGHRRGRRGRIRRPQLTAGALELDGEPRLHRPGRRSARASACCRRTASARRVHGPAGRREPVRPLLASARALKTSSSRAAEAIAYRRWHDALSIRPATTRSNRSGRSRAGTSRRCSSGGGWSGLARCS